LFAEAMMPLKLRTTPEKKIKTKTWWEHDIQTSGNLGVI
jgi:hypothetical protein